MVMSEVAPHRRRCCAGFETTCVVRFVTGLDNLAPLMFDADLAIGSGGMTAWERCVLGLPTLLVTAAENQRRGTLRRAGAVDFLGAAEHLQPGLWRSVSVIIAAAPTSSSTWRCVRPLYATDSARPGSRPHRTRTGADGTP